MSFLTKSDSNSFICFPQPNISHLWDTSNFLTSRTITTVSRNRRRGTEGPEETANSRVYPKVVAPWGTLEIPLSNSPSLLV